MIESVSDISAINFNSIDINMNIDRSMGVKIFID